MKYLFFPASGLPFLLNEWLHSSVGAFAYSQFQLPKNTYGITNVDTELAA
jgi:hypothetical protein